MSIAEEINMSQSAYAKIENGYTSIDVSRLLRISEFLEVPLTDFLPESEGQNIQLNANDGYQNIQAEHFYTDGRQLIQSKDQHIVHLEKEIEFLRNLIQNSNL